ncbi:MAG: nucleotidyltransferase family protein [Bacillota bacterium]
MKNLNEILISPSTSIMSAIKIIDAGSMQIALVVDDKNRLLGTVTDGDIRRGILKGISLDKPVREIMNIRPIFAKRSDNRENILRVMNQKQLKHIPVLDENGTVIELKILEDYIQPPRRDNCVVLMAGGLGNRLRPLTDDCPKPLLRVGSKPILEIILENFLEYGFRRFYISVNYKAEMVEEYFYDGSRWGAEISYIYEDKRLGTAGSLGLLKERPSQPVFVMNGDLLTKVNFQQLLDFHLDQKTMVTMCVREYDYQVPYGVTKIEKNRLVGIYEKPVQRYFVNAGIYVLEPETLNFVPQNTYYDMTDLLKKLIDQKCEIAVFPIREYWLDIGNKTDFERANGDYSEVFE